MPIRLERTVVAAAVRTAMPALAYPTAYAAALLVGRATRVEGSEVSLIWPAAAVAVLWGAHAHRQSARSAAGHWLLLGALTLAVNVATGATPELAVWFAGVNVVLAAVPAAVLARDGQRIELRDPTDLGRLVVAISVGTLAAAFLATIFLAAEGEEELTRTFVLFTVRNGVTALAGVAVVLRLRDARWRSPDLAGPRLLETLACVVVVVVVFGRVFWFNPGTPVAFAIMLPAVWVSLRYSTTTSTVFLGLAGVTIVWATLLDRGAIRGIAPHEQAALAQGMVGCLAVVVLTLALFRDSRNELIEQLRDLALHDPLTGLANRTLLTDRLDEALASDAPDTVGVIALDLDEFKTVNDAWGHAEGDLLLVEIARRLQEVVVPGDTAARIGGDEFVVVCTDLAGPDDLDRRAERIRERVADPYGLAADAPYDRITASVGSAMAERGATSRTLLHRADQAMYDAKRSGRDRTSRSRTVESLPRAPATPAAPSAR